MKNKKLLLAAILGSILVLGITGCAPTGGTIIVANDSSYQLDNVKISLGSSQVKELNPGERMKASVDKNIMLANVSFTLLDSSNILQIKYGDTMVDVPGFKGSWLLGIYTSPGISVNGGETITVTVKNKQP